MLHPSLVLNLHALVEEARNIARGAFLKKYRDPLLLAMGVLDTEEIRARCGSTTELSVSQPATHTPKEIHPLAGHVILIPITSTSTGSLVFGREEPADILVPDETVSVRHTIIIWEGPQVSITDAGSTNGTLVNLRALRANRPTQLINEDIITVGRHSFQFYLPNHFFRVLEGLATPPPMPE